VLRSGFRTWHVARGRCYVQNKRLLDFNCSITADFPGFLLKRDRQVGLRVTQPLSSAT